jgi:hypothetical protein
MRLIFNLSDPASIDNKPSILGLLFLIVQASNRRETLYNTMSNVTGGESSLSSTICEVAHSIDNYFSATLSQEYESI